MSVLNNRVNLMTGNKELVVENENYDLYQEVARSSFADMLHDSDRNRKYEIGIKSAIKKIHSRGEKALVLDIGTGTGILSMMAARNGADTIVACEAFKPMSECALKVIARNGFSDRIKVIPKASTELQVGEGLDLEERFNILVTEVFDTEVIGEGAIQTFTHAHNVLLQESCIVVPQSATVHVQLIESPLVKYWHKLKPIINMDFDTVFIWPNYIEECSGSPALHDIQISELTKAEDFHTIVPTTAVFQMDFSKANALKKNEQTITQAESTSLGCVHGLFMWWTLQMDDDTILSCAPKWDMETFNKGLLAWRDHWMQAVYFLPNEVKLTRGQTINIISCHDEFSMWFDIETDLTKNIDSNLVRPTCTCGMHTFYPRSRFAQLNDEKRNEFLYNTMESVINPESPVLIIGDTYYAALTSPLLGANPTYFYAEPDTITHKHFQDIHKLNNYRDSVVLLNRYEDIRDKIDAVFGEPYFIDSILPWDNFKFFHIVDRLREYMRDEVIISPSEASIKAVAVSFENLHKTRFPVRVCQGFNLSDFDKLIKEASSICDDKIEAQPLWEYPGKALSEVKELVTIYAEGLPDSVYETSGVFELKTEYGKCNGIALWVEWNHFGLTYPNGPIKPIHIGQYITWDKNSKQAVLLQNFRQRKTIKYDFRFDFRKGELSMNCF